MSFYNNYIFKYQADELAEKIIKRYKGYGVSINIKDKDITILEDRFKFGIKLLPGTTIDKIKRHVADIRMSLKLSLFQVVDEDLCIYFIVSKEFSLDNNLFRILDSPEYAEAIKEMQIAHPLGFDATGKPFIADLAKYPQLMTAGSTRSGKSVSLKALLLSIIIKYSPQEIKLLICDRVDDLDIFAGISHLAYPIIKDSETFLKVIKIVKNELDRRISLKHSTEFNLLPRIIFVIDEFLAFISGMADKNETQLAAKTLSDILRRGRHAKIHIVLAAHNPTQKNMHIDISDIPARMAFRCAKFTNSITIIGESGAEKLLGNGDMLFQSPFFDKPQRIQGAYVSDEQVNTTLKHVQLKYSNKSTKGKIFDLINDKKNGFTISNEDLLEIEPKFDLQIDPPINKREVDDKLLAKIIIWVLAHNSISCNLIKDTFRIGWKRADEFLEKLYGFGIVGNIYAKLPRSVIPVDYVDLSDDIVSFLNKHGYSEEVIKNALSYKALYGD
jgi:S-DNA-T family DNA segregation ATPase FtsK/SpoIIIE